MLLLSRAGALDDLRDRHSASSLMRSSGNEDGPGELAVSPGRGATPDLALEECSDGSPFPLGEEAEGGEASSLNGTVPIGLNDLANHQF